MSNFYTADAHFYHRNIISYCNRPFSSVEEMNEKMIEAWNSVVGVHDEVWHLGDFCLANKKEDLLVILYRLHGTIYLLPGSHDSNLRRLDESHKYSVVSPLITEELEDRVLVMCHYPMSEWPKSRHGSFHIHGHSHGNRLREIPRSWDVGVDSHNFRPWSEEEILERMVQEENGTKVS